MSVLHIVVLALVQGLTEFLPISSHGHLNLVNEMLEGLGLITAPLPEEEPVLFVAVHVGTLGAVVVYFWRDLWTMVLGLVRLTNGRMDAGARLAGYLVIATVPVVIAGFAVNYYATDALRSVTVIAWATLVFGIVLYVADRTGMTVRHVEHLGVGDAVIIGCAQVLALIPGASRSGITMSAARLLGMERAEAARFSMLLSIPAILGAGTLKGLDLYRSGDVELTAAAVLAAGLAFAIALPTIFALMAWLQRSTFTPFVVYRVFLGGALLALAYGWIG
ncbi:MAG: undecaprenyl-diphosphate phosphatase [Alphaproteobacteria bacterium]|nr:undecaprenyl-diphosphate phosphatase [Alphaproteobacteria bacterium]